MSKVIDSEITHKLGFDVMAMGLSTVTEIKK